MTLVWRKQPRRGFVGVMWIGAVGAVDVFGIALHIIQHGRRRRSSYRLFRIVGGPAIAGFAKLAEAKAKAESLQEG